MLQSDLWDKQEGLAKKLILFRSSPLPRGIFTALMLLVVKNLSLVSSDMRLCLDTTALPTTS